MANTATRTYTFTGQSNTYTENKTVTIPIENFTVTGDTTQTPSSVDSFTVSHYHSCSGSSSYVWQLYVEILFENGNTRQSDTVGHSCNGTVVQWTNTFTTITGEDLQSGIKTVSIKIANAPSSGKPYLYWRAITGNPITMITTFNTHVAVAPVIDESATGISSSADYAGFYNGYTVPVFTHSVSYDEEAGAKANSKVLAIQVYDKNGDAISSLAKTYTINTTDSYSLDPINDTATNAQARFPLRVVWTFTVTDTNNLTDTMTGQFTLLYYSSPVIQKFEAVRWGEDLYGSVTVGEGDRAGVSITVSGVYDIGKYIIPRATIAENGASVVGQVISSANSYNLAVYQVTPGDVISEITTSITVVYAFFAEAPALNSVSYGNSYRHSGSNTVTNITVPNGVNWIAIRVAQSTGAITYTNPTAIQNSANIELYVQQEGNSRKTVITVPGGTGLLPNNALVIDGDPESSGFTEIDTGTRYTSTSYVYTLNIRDLISTSVDTANLAASTVLFNIEKTGVGIGKYSSRGTASNPLLEVAMDADFTGVAMFNGYGLNGVTTNVNTYFFTSSDLNMSFLTYDPTTSPDYAARVTRLGPFVFLQGEIDVSVGLGNTLIVRDYNVCGSTGNVDIPIISHMPTWAVPYGPQIFGKLMRTGTNYAVTQHLPYEVRINPIQVNDTWDARMFFHWPVETDEIANNTSFTLTACWIARDIFE